MNQAIHFKTSIFDVSKENENPINPIYGISLLEWLRVELEGKLEITEPDAEDCLEKAVFLSVFCRIPEGRVGPQAAIYIMSKETGYRAFPKEIPNPAQGKYLSGAGLSELEPEKMEEAQSACPGHEGTVIWYVDKRGYIVEVKIRNRSSVLMEPICTFTPTFGMDSIDGVFAQDVEEYILDRELGFRTGRLDIFQGRNTVPVEEYLRSQGVIK